LDNRDVDRILSDLDVRGQAYDGVHRREHERYTYRGAPGLLVTIEHPGGSATTYRVMPRNLSSGGLGFLHGNFMYEGTAASLQLRRVDGKMAHVPGKVVRCHHVRGKVHEVGVRFASEINLCDFLSDAARPEDMAGEPDVPMLRGMMVYVEDCVDDRELMRFYVERLGVQATMTDDAAEAIDLAAAMPVDVVVASVNLTQMDGPTLLAKLREAGYDGPFVAVQTDEPDTRGGPSARYNEVLVKPFGLTRFARTLAAYLPPAEVEAKRGDEGPLPSMRWYDVKMRPLIQGFLHRLEGRMQELQTVVAVGPQSCDWRKLLRELKGSAGSYGYPQISEIAQDILTMSQADEGLDRARRQVHELIRLCDRACLIVRRSDRHG
jgi:CheY-like chemotaxis protein/HPt (histidine-containing phosphotransfer) domain-containing protein